MSGAIKAARSGMQPGGRAMPGTGYAGDPGLFGFLGKAIKGVGGALLGGTPVGSAISTGMKIGKGIFGSKGGTRQRKALARGRMVQQVAPGPVKGLDFAQLRQTFGRGLSGPIGSIIPKGSGPTQGQILSAVGPAGGQRQVMLAGPGGACPSGYKANKTGYWVTSPMGTPSFVSPGERCVKIRKRNPINPRAWDRAYSRLKSSKRFAKKLGSITMRDTCPHK